MYTKSLKLLQCVFRSSFFFNLVNLTILTRDLILRLEFENYFSIVAYYQTINLIRSRFLRIYDMIFYSLVYTFFDN